MHKQNLKKSQIHQRSSRLYIKVYKYLVYTPDTKAILKAKNKSRFVFCLSKVLPEKVFSSSFVGCLTKTPLRMHLIVDHRTNYRNNHIYNSDQTCNWSQLWAHYYTFIYKVLTLWMGQTNKQTDKHFNILN